MVVYYFCSEDKYGVEVYNGAKAILDALKGETPFDDAVNITVRSGDLCVCDIPSKESLIQELPNIIANAEAAGMNTFFIPNDNFISKDTMRKHILEVIAGADNNMIELLMFSMTPIAFFGELTSEELREEILYALEDYCANEEDEEA